MLDRERPKLFDKLCKMCNQHRVIPESMNIPDFSEDTVEVERGELANVSQSTYKGRHVALKVVHVYTTNDLDVILDVSAAPGCHTCLNEQTAETLLRGCCLEAPPASQHLATPWNNSE